jgi:hypothetical protein
MENNILDISQRTITLAHQLAPTVTGFDAEMEIANTIAEELLPGLNTPEDIKKALVNMLIVGNTLKK